VTACAYSCQQVFTAGIDEFDEVKEYTLSKRLLFLAFCAVQQVENEFANSVDDYECVYVV